MEDSSRIGKLEKEIAELKEMCKASGSERKSKKERKPREPSEYNIFMKKELATLKTKFGENYDHKKAFKSAAESWTKNKK
jgi:hypothetical protein